MSAIYGLVNKRDFSSPQDVLERMKQGYSNCIIDKYDSLESSYAAVACGLQYITEESKREILPFENEEYIYTADVIIDNRLDVMNQLDLSDESIPDGELLFRAFIEWGVSLHEYVYGIYSAFLYNKNSREWWLFTDPTGSRCVYYYEDDTAFFFSTIIQPILNVVGADINLSEAWITNCMSNCSADLMLVPELTPFENIYQLEAGCYLHSKNNTVEKRRYYYPHMQKLKISDDEGIALFRTTFKTCVGQLLRSSGETAITLSSGLDSTAVACTAVNELKNQGKKLYSFTSYPIDEYKESDDSYIVPNEIKGVMKLKADFPEIDMEFVNCPHRNAFTDIAKMVPILECPYKSAVNIVWIDEIYKKARNKNCKIVLKGQYGNSTISYGTLMTTVYQLCMRRRFARAYKEIKRFAEVNHYSRKYVIKVIIQAFRDNRISKTDYFEEALIKQELLDTNQVQSIFNKLDKEEANCWVDKEKQQFNSVWSSRILAHLGSFDTKLGLANGIVVRDPCKDRRIMELCLNLPITCMAGNGVERRLVREGMEGIVPEYIRKDIFHRGEQGADFALRMDIAQEEILSKFSNYIENNKLNKYIDWSKVEDIMADISKTEHPFSDNTRNAVKVLVLSSLSEFLEIYG